MGTTLGNNVATTPGLKLRNVGDFVDFFVVDLDENLPRTEYGTGQPKMSRDGSRQLTQHRLVVLVVGGQGVINTEDGDRPVSEGEVVAIYIAGRDKWDPDLDKGRTGNVGRSFGAARDKLDGGLQVGDFGRWKFEAEVPGQGTQPRKVRTFQLRHAKADEAEQEQRCEQLHAARKGQAASQPGDQYEDDEEPF